MAQLPPDPSAPPIAPPIATDTPAVTRVAAYLAVVLSGAIFGFFYAWVCSTMWGLDAADPRVAIEAMQAMNASVRNAVFFPAFFLTAPVLGLAGLLARRAGRPRASMLLLVAGAVHLVGGLLVTMAVNVPMNEGLAATAVPRDRDEAQAVWDAYSGRWQAWNAVRTLATGTGLVLAVAGLAALGSPRGPRPPVDRKRLSGRPGGPAPRPLTPSEDRPLERRPS